MEKIQIQFIIERIQEWDGGIQEEESGKHYWRKYLIATKPFNYRGKEYSQLAIYTNGYLSFEDISRISSWEKEKKLLLVGLLFTFIFFLFIVARNLKKIVNSS